MSLERNGKSPPTDDDLRRPRGQWRWLLVGVAIGCLLGPILNYLVRGFVWPTYKFEVIFVKHDLPEAGVQSMQLDGRLMEHLFVTPHFVMTRPRTTSGPNATVTFAYRLSPDTPVMPASVDLMSEPWRRGCTAEVVIAASGIINRGCVAPIKSLF
jgi:hypothetical protein